MTKILIADDDPHIRELVLIVDLPDTEHAMKTSAALSKLLGISFTTAPALSMEVFDKLIG